MISEETEVNDRAWTARHHDLTHEVELIISAGLLFGLLQTPGRLNALFDGVQAGLSGVPWTVVFVGWYYATLIIYTLTLAFGVHILSRGYWVGLVGLDSAFPRGIRWSDLRYGPIAKDFYREEVPPVPTLARRVDRFCSSIFAIAFWIAALFAMSVVVAGGIGLAALALERVFPGIDSSTFWLALMVAVGSVPIGIIFFDRVWGPKLARDGAAAGRLKRVLRVFHRSVGGNLILPIQFTLFSNLPRTMMWPFYIGTIVVLLSAFLGGQVIRSKTFIVATAELLPTRPTARTVDRRSFADSRSASDRTGSAPFIQSEIVTGPYVRLELPWVARRHGDRLGELCEGEEAIGSRGLTESRSTSTPADAAAIDTVLECMGRMWTVELDGRPVDIEWDFRWEPGRGVTAVVGYIATAGIDAGAHTLVVSEEETADPDDDGDEPSVRRHFIRFRL